MKIFVASLSLFCFYVLHCPQAKASAPSVGEQYFRELGKHRHENIFSELTKQSGEKVAYASKWQACADLGIERASLFLPFFYCARVPGTFRFAGARQFYFRTGLSPPALLA